MQTIFKNLQSSFFNTTLRRKYDINEESENRVRKIKLPKANILSHIYFPLSSIGVKPFKENKYNKMETEKITISS